MQDWIFFQLCRKQGSVSSSLEAQVCSAGSGVGMVAATSVSSDSLTPLDPLVILSSVEQGTKQREALTWNQQGSSTVPRLENERNNTNHRTSPAH